jgi:predicted TIM-barrel fold metal-dependent hydrolase
LGHTVADLTRISRRDWLKGAAALGVAASLAPRGAVHAQTTAGARRLDLHHHFASPRWASRVVEAKRQGWQQIQEYTPAKAIAAMDAAGVATAFLSCTEPGVWFGDDFARERQDAIALSRDMNEFGARMVGDYKGRFGLFAVLPLPDIDASLKEIAYAFDTLKADGVGLLTSYGTVWLGDASLSPVFDELNRRNAIVYTHPTDATCCHALLKDTSPGTIEWQTDTSRAIFNLINDAGGRVSMASRYPNVRFIWSHGGGTLIALAGRFLGYGNLSQQDLAAAPAPNSRLYHLRRFYYDTAQATSFVQLNALKSLVGATQIVFGADYPYSTIVNHVEQLRETGFSAAELAGIDRENALRILPKYR